MGNKLRKNRTVLPPIESHAPLVAAVSCATHPHSLRCLLIGPAICAGIHPSGLSTFCLKDDVTHTVDKSSRSSISHAYSLHARLSTVVSKSVFSIFLYKPDDARRYTPDNVVSYNCLLYSLGDHNSSIRLGVLHTEPAHCQLPLAQAQETVLYCCELVVGVEAIRQNEIFQSPLQSL
ncbi:hypothetical protein PsorP6_015328 [Peronosclerospora sorghi]|uniref:Uncharacterized protein n=1 Tax=Peronosclerospora sorghi TaxID=230839 RepID=A0ACC0VTQ3_9STRA|nr:hypothetical protein PsorP6_015328 [Peronosclerospora sorghi]